jgi:ATP-dependent exoDNAse (exonuclease V) beta subunit
MKKEYDFSKGKRGAITKRQPPMKDRHPSSWKIIKLHKKWHKYYVTGENYNIKSVTKFVNTFFPKFEKKKVAKKYARKHNLNWEDVVAEWTRMGKEAAKRGNKYHALAESVYKKYKKKKYKKNVNTSKISKMIETRLLNLYKEYEPYDPEYIVCSLELELAGTIDLLFGQDDTLLIADWKFVKEVKRTNQWENALFPIQHLENCNYYKFCLQLNTYSAIIKRERYFPQHKNHKMIIFHVTEDGIEDIVIPNMKQSVRNMMVQWEKLKSG